MDEKELKNLLDEAITYKNPRDANDKSDTFKVSFQFYFFHNKISYHNLFLITTTTTTTAIASKCNR